MSDSGPDEFPGTVQRLWFGGVSGKRGPKPALSVESIVRAAIEIADADGIAAVSMAKVAEALGCTSMALYRHVANKDELLVLMADAVGGLMTLPDTDGLTWREGLERWATTQVEGMLARPWMLDLPLSSVVPGPQRMEWIDAGFGILRELDISFIDKLAILGLLSQFVLGQGHVEVESRRAAAAVVRREAGLDDSTPFSALDPAAVEAANPYSGFEALMATVAGPDRFPHIAEAIAGADPTGLEQDLQFGLRVVLDGIERFVEEKAR
ncbi:TetR/AcrR family transcriptional regulator [Gordonia sp. PKS22-38]|uniref:TetR/AcrR family transcriptional regulator n=1 Tax=Gordonia prachuapensis TaxID=3115651 RepID=A0ABU7MXC2_9ACTN|nr:TetR/AcrR family transcriptional regulator [Gordonia sp. PKS22-38]